VVLASCTDRRSAARLISLVVIVVSACTVGTSDALAAECSRKVNDAQPGEPVDPPITLTPTTQSAQRQLNFDTDREPKAMSRIVVTADKALPKDLTKEQLGYDAALSRTGDTLESTDFPTPTFTDPKIRADGKTIIFSACLNPDDSDAGKYVGFLELNGPDGVSAASINIAVNLKEDALFWPGVFVALAGAVFLLLVKDAAVVQPGVAKAAVEAARKKADAAKGTADADKEEKAAQKAAGSPHWFKALLVPLRDLRWWAATSVAVVSAFGVMYAAYSNDPAWGATGLSAVASLIAMAFGAIGGQTILRSFAAAK
jgi:hypothetical protein